MADSKITAFRFSDDELAMLEMIQGHTGIRSRTEALRAVLEYYVKSKGLAADLPGDGPREGGTGAEASDGTPDDGPEERKGDRKP